MGRTKSYDEQHVLQILAKEFSQSGFEGTSIDQIAKATGMKRGSIYQAFDSKANLFRLAFQNALDATGDNGLLADLLFVALWERAAIDPDVSSASKQAIAHLEQTTGESIATILRQRLYLRAGIVEESGEKVGATHGKH